MKSFMGRRGFGIMKLRYTCVRQEFERIIQYILNNPVKAGLVAEWTSWKSTYINPEFGSW